jgi:hypothetical protein
MVPLRKPFYLLRSLGAGVLACLGVLVFGAVLVKLGIKMSGEAVCLLGGALLVAATMLWGALRT